MTTKKGASKIKSDKERNTVTKEKKVNENALDDKDEEKRDHRVSKTSVKK